MYGTIISVLFLAIGLDLNVCVNASPSQQATKRSMGRGGNLQLKIESIRLADGELAPVRAVKDVKGGGHQIILAGMMSTFLFDSAGPEARAVE